MKKLLLLTATSLLVLLALGLFTGCSQQSTVPTNKILKVGVTAGPHAEIMDVVKKVEEIVPIYLEKVKIN